MTPAKNVALISSGHPADDERLYHKIAASLLNHGFGVTLISSQPPRAALPVTPPVVVVTNDGLFRKCSGFAHAVHACAPDVIICAEVLPVLPAFIEKMRSGKPVKIILDVTEWYPENVSRKGNGLFTGVSFVAKYLLLILASMLTDAFTYGEKGKFRRYQGFAPRKPALSLGYFPPLRNIVQREAPRERFTLCYSGILSDERGFNRFLNLLETISRRGAAHQYKALIIGSFPGTGDREAYTARAQELDPHLQIEFHEWSAYADFLAAIADADLCLDLREQNQFYTNSLPIKLFDFLAAGKPVISSDLKVLHEAVNFSDFGFLVDPKDNEMLFTIVERYRTDRALYMKHAATARSLAESTYNWGREETKLVEFIQELLS
jgi:glycosyltransferase involved in cell wall biosynthesis